MPFDAEWFNELRNVTEEVIAQTKARGIHDFVPKVDELNRDGHVTNGFVEETHRFVNMFRAPFQLDEHFRSYARLIIDWPTGRTFRKQWNISFGAGLTSVDDEVRIGIGFRLSERPEAGPDSIMDYAEFKEYVRNHPAAFDRTFQALGNYLWMIGFNPSAPDVSENAARPLSDIVAQDEFPPDCWRFFGRRLRMSDPQDQAIVLSHQRLRDAAVEVFRQIQAAGFGM